MAERGALPAVPARTQAMLKAARAFFTPLLPDDYLEMIDPLWSTRELRGRIVGIELETRDVATLTIKPGWGVARAQAGPISAGRHRRRRCAPLACLLDYFRSRA